MQLFEGIKATFHFRFAAICIVILLKSLMAQGFQKRIITEFNQHFPHIEILTLIGDTRVLATAETDGTRLLLILTQGLLEAPKLTEDSLRIILCHELGHLLGGDPRQDPPVDWTGPIAHDGRTYISSEGQADYYAVSSCFPKLLMGGAAEQPKPVVGLNVVSQCDESWGANSFRSIICMRAIRAGYDFLRLSFDFDISFDAPDEFISPVLIRNHYPSRQCRLDTFISGSLKNKSRPPCWFATSLNQ